MQYASNVPVYLPGLCGTPSGNSFIGAEDYDTQINLSSTNPFGIHKIPLDYLVKKCILYATMPEEKTETVGLVTVPSEKKKRNHRKEHEDDFVVKTRIRLSSGEFLPVPVDAESNRNACIMMAESARLFVADQIEKWSNAHRILTPAEVKDVVAAAKLANEASIIAHENIMPPPETNIKGGRGPAGDMLRGVEAMAKGIAKGNAEAQNEAIRKFTEMGNKVKEATVIDVRFEKA